jgi:hypothetical protein
VTALRSAILDAVTVADMKAITQGLVTLAKGGDVQAARTLYAYVVGRAVGDYDPEQADRDDEREKQERERARRDDALSMRTNREMAEMFSDAAARYATLPPDEPAAKAVHSLDECIEMARADLASLEAELAQQRGSNGN